MSGSQKNLSVAAIVPVYNVEKYLRQCLDSLLGQTCAFSDIILVDDGSTDASGAICDEYAESCDIVSVVHKRNAGLGFARNSGLDAISATTDYVMFIDSDDWLDPCALEILVGAMRGSCAECVMGGHTKRDNDSKKLFELKLGNREYRGEEIRNELMPRLCGSAPSLSDSIPMSSCSSLFSAEYIAEHDLRFPSEREVLSEDFVFKFNALLYASRVITCDFTQYNYRTNPRSLSMSYRPDRFEATLRFYGIALKMINAAGLPHEAITRMQKTLFIYLRKCISQELPQASGKPLIEAVDAVRSMVDDACVRAVVLEYPIGQLGWKQRTFVYMLRKRQAHLLLFMAKLGVL